MHANSPSVLHPKGLLRLLLLITFLNLCLLLSNPFFPLGKVVFSQYVWTPPVVIDTSTPNLRSQGYPAMAVDDGGGIIVAWGDALLNDSNYVILERSTDGGGGWQRSVPFGLRYVAFVHDVAFDHSGNIWLLWTEKEADFAPYYLKLSKSTDNGATFETLFSGLEYADGFFSPRIAVDGHNSVYILWDDSQFQLTKFRHGDISQRSDAVIPRDTLGVDWNPALVISRDFMVYCLWEGFYYTPGDTGGLYQFIFCSASADTGLTFLGRTRVDTTSASARSGFQAEPAAAVDSIGNLYVSLRRHLVSNADIRVCKSVDRGSSFLAPVIVSDSSSYYRPNLSIDSAQGINVLWGNHHSRSTNGGKNFSVSTGYAVSDLESEKGGNLYACTLLGVAPNSVVAFTKTNILVDVKTNDDVPGAFVLSQNYPNPFNSTTTIQFSLPRAEQIQLNVYDLLGQEVAQLVSGQMVEGVHAVRWDAGGLSSGVYFMRLLGGKEVAVQKIILMR